MRHFRPVFKKIIKNYRRVLYVAACAAFAIFSAPEEIPAQTPPPSSSPPEIRQLRYDEDNEYYCRSENRRSFYARIKCVPLQDDKDNQAAKKTNYYLSFGGEIREQGEYYDYPLWGEEEPRNGYLLQRYMLHADLRLGTRLRFFGQVKSGLERGRKGGGRVTDVDKFDLHQAFADIVLWRKEKDSINLRVGRQEIAFGASRLVSFREGPNVRQSFDGIRTTFQKNDWRIDAFALKPVATNPGYFDDASEQNRTLWGVYAAHPLKITPQAKIDLYYLGYDRKRARFQAGAGRERRQTLGARIWGAYKNWDYDNELIFQFGRFAASDINALAFAAAYGYTLEKRRFRPRFGLDGGIASGDRQPNDGKLNTFNALFPKGKYFGEAELLGPYNIIAVQPSVKFILRENVKLTVYNSYFWRENKNDGIYGVPGNLIRPGNSNEARYVGSHINAEFEWEINRNLSFTAVYQHFFAGGFLRETGESKAVNFYSAWFTYKF